MPEKKTIVILGATGAHAGGLVRAILSDPAGGFAARAITRDVKSEKARALTARRDLSPQRAGALQCFRTNRCLQASARPCRIAA